MLSRILQENSFQYNGNDLREMLSRILQENSFQYNGNDFLHSHGTVMGKKMAVAFANIFMAKIERPILRQSNTTPIFWKRFIDDMCQCGTQTETKEKNLS